MSCVWSDGDGRGSDFSYVCDDLLKGSGVVEENGTDDDEENENETDCVSSYCHEGICFVCQGEIDILIVIMSIQAKFTRKAIELGLQYDARPTLY